jgi:hypothetical protein
MNRASRWSGITAANESTKPSCRSTCRNNSAPPSEDDRPTIEHGASLPGTSKWEVDLSLLRHAGETARAVPKFLQRAKPLTAETSTRSRAASLQDRR